MFHKDQILYGYFMHHVSILSFLFIPLLFFPKWYAKKYGKLSPEINYVHPGKHKMCLH